MAKFDMNAMLKQAQQSHEAHSHAQQQASLSHQQQPGPPSRSGRRSSSGRSAGGSGGRSPISGSRSRTGGGGELVEIRIDPRAIDPDDPEMLADMVLAAANEALRTAQAAVEAKLRAQMPDLGALGLPGF